MEAITVHMKVTHRQALETAEGVTYAVTVSPDPLAPVGWLTSPVDGPVRVHVREGDFYRVAVGDPVFLTLRVQTGPENTPAGEAPCRP